MLTAKIRFCTWHLLIVLLIAGCSKEYPMLPPVPVSDAAFDLIAPGHTGVNFVNAVNESPTRHIGMFDYMYNGAGVAVGDFNNDDLPDLFFTGNDVPNRLYINHGNFQFEDVSERAGIMSGHWSTGVTLVDINNDGWLDIYVSNSGPYMAAAQLKNQLYINQQNLTFKEQAAEYGIDDDSRSIQSTFFDMDNDGDLDLFVMNHALRNRSNKVSDWFGSNSSLSVQESRRQSSTLYRNNGNGSFEDISAQAGIEKTAFGLCLAVSDFDENGYLDIYVGNDYFIPDFMFLNNGDGTFTDRAKLKLGHSPYYSMGCDAADFNNDGLQDMVIVDMTPADHVRNKSLMASMDTPLFDLLTIKQGFLPQYMFNSLYVNRGYGVMSDIGLMAGVAQTDWSWAALLADFDNDGRKDLFVSNGYRRDTKDNDWLLKLAEIREGKGKDYAPADYFEHLQTASSTPIPNQVFRNTGNLDFANTTLEWGLDQASFSNGAAYADLDRDGDLDLVVNNIDSPAFIYRNNQQEKNPSNYLQVRLKQGKNHNRVLNAKVSIHYGDQLQSQEYAFTRGYQSFVQPEVHFGLGAVAGIDSLEILWHDGQLTRIEKPELNRVLTVDRDEVASVARTVARSGPLFKDVTATLFNSVFIHKENPYNDFATEVLLPHRQSTLGPALAVADLNNDGLEDFYIGGAQGQSGVLYLQQPDASFQQQWSDAIAKDFAYEDLGALIFDADGDGDNDLYVASGGDGQQRADALQDRLYLNDGQGNFARAAALPPITSSTKVVAAHDWDDDGDLDLFVGGRTMPGQYPFAPRSYFLQNDNGSFTDVTDHRAPALSAPGMVTGAVWSDLDRDGNKELVVLGEWMPITVIRKIGETFVDQTAQFGLGNTTGWWSSIAAADFDGDGDEDFILGNIGRNNKYQPTAAKPLYVFANDFDDTGSIDIVLSKIYHGEKVPVRGRQCTSAQMPVIGERFPSYRSFATASLNSIYGDEKLAASVHYEATQFASMYLENRGNGDPVLSELPVEAQLAPIHGVVIRDFDGDGKPDVVVAGNTFNTEVETPRYDAGRGLYLQGRGGNSFSTSLQMAHSGLFLYRNVKAIRLIHLGDGRRPALVVANNNSPLQVVTWTR